MLVVEVLEAHCWVDELVVVELDLAVQGVEPGKERFVIANDFI